ncbi:sugar kinase [Lusitaniella coriacea]|uniref:sugar kinase n=1 Tax=Lusitaniella coriacea TaxID=1983105 RepID=UPI003CFA7A13
MSHHCLFIGMIALDFIYLVEEFPEPNEKIVALEGAIAAGGPATNAAVTCAALGSRATLVGAVGNATHSNLIRADLAAHNVQLLDLATPDCAEPPVSSIIVTKSTGDRAVVSLNATRAQIPPQQLPEDLLREVDLILLDGHQMKLSRAIAPQAKAQNIPIVLDGGSWKPGLEDVLPFVDYAICSGDFYPPNCTNSTEVFAYLSHLNIPHIAITQGEKPIQYRSQGKTGTIEIQKIQAIDTLGAGDIFHGAFAQAILQQPFPDALTTAAQIATYACQFFGTRSFFKNSGFLKS